MTTAFETYIAKVEADYRGGKATELTYRGTWSTSWNPWSMAWKPSPPAPPYGALRSLPQGEGRKE
jgi:hypothetical protein